MMARRAFAATLFAGVVAVGALAASGAARADDSATKVATYALSYQGEVSEGIKAACAARLAAGLAASGMHVSGSNEVKDVLGKASCSTPRCLKKLWVMLGARYVVGGTVKGADRTYDMTLWVSDARTTKRLAEVKQRCEICGLAAMSRAVDLAASSLAAKLAGTARAPARYIIDSKPSGAVIELNGKVVGTTPKELTLVEGKHRVVLRLAGYLAGERTLRAVSGVQERVEIHLVEEGGGGPRRPLWRTLAWIGAGAGAAALAAGVVLLAIDGGGINCGDALSVTGGQCAQLRDTVAGGAVLTGLGAAALLGSAYLFYYTWPRHRERAHTRGAHVAVGPGSILLRGEF